MRHGRVYLAVSRDSPIGSVYLSRVEFYFSRYRRGEPIDTATSTGSKVNISALDDGRRHRMTVRHVQFSDAGQYSVAAAAGDADECADRKSSAMLTVVDAPAPGNSCPDSDSRWM